MKFKEHKKLFDIEWFDGPLLSLFKNKDGAFILYKWTDVGEAGHTWLVFETNKELLAAYTQQIISEKALILLAPEKKWCLVDISPQLNYSNERLLGPDQLKQQVLPQTHVFFKIEDCPDPHALSTFIQGELVMA